MINIISTKIPDLKIIEPQIFEDDRGYFFESFNLKKFNDMLNLNINFVQDNHSKSLYGVLRGLNYQSPPFEQGKLVRVLSGEVFDVAVDLRKNSNTYGSWYGLFLSAKNKKQLWIPPGFAHGFLVTSTSAEFFYKTTQFYNKDHEECIIYNDSVLNIQWPILDISYILSSKDLIGKKFND